MKDKILRDFAELVLRTGVNIQEGQGLELVCPVEKADVAEVFTEVAYKLKAKIVNIRWENEKIDRLNYLNAKTTALCDVPKWYVDSKNYLVEKGFCYVAISAEDPSAFNGVPAEKIAAVAKARGKLLKRYFENVMANAIRWCVVSVPTERWAKKVFPNSADPEKDLSLAISASMRLNAKDPVKKWREHIETLNRHADFLNQNDFAFLHFTSKNGTDFTLGLADGHIWTAAEETAKDGVKFVANMPTEEVFTAPHRLKADGKVVSAMPLCYEGNIIDDFSLTFKKGKIVDFSAKIGYDTLKSIIETDDGTRRLGEVALIGKNSPIAKSGVLFYNTLFDENASCHIALGKAYPTTIKDGNALSAKERKARGLNDSVEHVDLMIGTKDLSVTGIKKDGEEIPVFKDGEWAF